MSEVLNPTALNGMVTKLLSDPVVFPVYPTINEPPPCAVCIGARLRSLCRRCAEMCRGNGLQFGENPGAGGFELLFCDEVPGEEAVEAVQAGGDAATFEGRGKR